ncbi:uncharacterized protein LOC133193673 [Saccostrea echinata]|uniref:uncharacterized protein LOC133193673 n=1 Tax=Saccostrea echinata TaxID=191078 RepID=UPI002A815595|nr:uncharacterized protein LOC133193673 [Saccostrea echinata]
MVYEPAILLYTKGPCKTGYLYSRQYGYCLRYVGQLRGQEMIEVCEKNDEELIKVNSLEENNFVSGLAFSLMQDPIGTRRLLIDGLFSSGKWISMFGNGSRLIFTNFYAGNGIPEENHIITMFTGNLTHFSEFKWRSKSGKFLRRSVICRYYP